MSIFEEFPFMIPFFSVIIALSGVIITVLIYNKTSKDKARQLKTESDLQIEALSRQKLKDDALIAKEVKEEAKRIAVDTKDEMMDIIKNVIERVQNDISRNKLIIESELKLMTQNVLQNKADISRYVEAQQVINDRMEKSLNFVSQFLWGQGAKSIPPYLQGMEETQSHKDEPLKGIYIHPDSTETQERKDELKELGKDSTISEIIRIQKEIEEKRFQEHSDDKNFVHSIDEVEEQKEKEKNEKKVKKEGGEEKK